MLHLRNARESVSSSLGFTHRATREIVGSIPTRLSAGTHLSFLRPFVVGNVLDDLSNGAFNQRDHRAPRATQNFFDGSDRDRRGARSASRRHRFSTDVRRISIVMTGTALEGRTAQRR
jgi:hypothetical protein